MFLVLYSLAACESIHPPVDYVNPFIGTDGHGHTFPGATMPFGMVQLSPDTRKDSWDGCSGYHYSDNQIIGFSHTHLSGTGVGDYGDIRLMPTVGKLKLDAGNKEQEGYRSEFSHENEKASPGYYSVQLTDYQIKAELTAAEHSGFHRYTFPQSKNAHILVDLFESVVTEQILNAEITIVNDSTIAGFRQTKAWAADQHCYFYAVFSKPFRSFGIRVDGEEKSQLQKATGKNLIAWTDFDTKTNEQIMVKVGISAVDIEGAKNNLAVELPNWKFDKKRKAAKEAWNNELGKIKVEGKSKKDKTIFYTALYHTMLAPNLFSDLDGRFRGHDGNIHTDTTSRRYTVFSLWDTFRALHPLFTIIQRERTGEFVNTMLDIYDKGGLLPVWELAGNETWCMIGYHAVPAIADAWANGIRNFDGNKALIAMQKSAMQDQFGLEWYKQKGYIPADKESESVSKTLEYAFDDWCIAKMAESIGNDSVKQLYFKRSEHYKNLYDPTTKFFRGRQNGGFISPFDPTQVNFMLTEANSWQYNFFVPHDIQTHIRLMGGDDAYENMLDQLFTASSDLSGRQQADITGLIGQYAHGNEPSHHMAYLYNYVQKPGKTQQLVKRIMDEMYSDQPDGLSGNEDCGQMSAWYVMSAMGFYPVTPASGRYIIGSPRFEEVTIRLENKKTFVVKAKNLSDKKRFIKSATFNGQPYFKSFISADEIQQGGELIFVMDTVASESFGIGKGNFPVQNIETESLIPVPWVTSDGKTFTSLLEISMGHIDRDVVITYTTNGKEPTLASKRYTEPFIINRTTNLKVKAFKFDRSSETVGADFFKIAGGRTITLVNDYNAQYHAGGDNALIDHIKGGSDFRTGAWQGFQGDDLVAVIDLGNQQLIKRLDIGFLQDQNSWIFMPQYVEFQVSLDGEQYESLGKIYNNVSEKENGGVVQRFVKKTDNQLVRYVKVIGLNRGLCPDWHIGKGEPAWLFADEIVIE
ncbi:MAG: glycoside hydrolase family 92 protein [Bacteroidales bacterium]|nr:glycoside hydrolase family 92 protein [Bacteroidales bacterium]